MALKKRIKALQRAHAQGAGQGCERDAQAVKERAHARLVPEDTGALLGQSGEILAGGQLGHWISRGRGVAGCQVTLYGVWNGSRTRPTARMTPAAEQGKGLLRANVAKHVKGVI
jgi:hypothetical protein